MNNQLECAHCKCDIKDNYFMVGDNYLQVKYFEELDGSDNIFCSKDCLCESLSVMEMELYTLEEYEEAMMDTLDICDICDNDPLDPCPYIETDDRESCPKYRKAEPDD